MKGCIFITMKDCTPGFTLAGFRQVVADEKNILEAVAKIVNTTAPGLLFIDERMLAERDLGRLRLLEKQWGGAIITLPSPGRAEVWAGKDFGRRFVSRVLGYQMKLS